MKAPFKKPIVKLIGKDGNAFAILARVQKALRINGADSEYIKNFMMEATSGDYDNLLGVVSDYVEVI